MEIYMDCRLLGVLPGHPTTAIGRVGGDGGGAWSQAIGVVSSLRVYPCRIEAEELERISDAIFCPRRMA